MIPLIISYIISHGMLDFYTFKYFNDIFKYTLLVIFNYFMFYISPDFVFMIFLFFSMYHFGEDMRYLTDGKSIDRNNGILLITTLGLVNTQGIDFFCNTLYLNKELFYNLFFTLYIFSFVVIFFTNIKSIIISCIITLCIVCSCNFFISYLVLIHVPLAIYRYYINYGKDVVYSWITFMSILYFILDYTINVFIIKLSISIVNIHMIYITKWQLE